jgi:hypothetical protein
MRLSTLCGLHRDTEQGEYLNFVNNDKIFSLVFLFYYTPSRTMIPLKNSSTGGPDLQRQASYSLYINDQIIKHSIQ